MRFPSVLEQVILNVERPGEETVSPTGRVGGGVRAPPAQPDRCARGARRGREKPGSGAWRAAGATSPAWRQGVPGFKESVFLWLWVR